MQRLTVMSGSRHASLPKQPSLNADPDHEVPRPVAISWIGLLIPFAIVMIALAVSGRHSLSQYEMGLVLIAIPFALYVLRRRADRTRRTTPRED